MAKITPDLSEAQLKELSSQAEAKVYRALRDKLPQDYEVFFQVGWILRREEEQAKDGETDFLVCHPDHGYLCIEVKGGGIEFDPLLNEWYSVNRNQQKFLIKDPVRQALKAKYSIRTKLIEQPIWRNFKLGNVLQCHAVFFPDVSDTSKFSRPDMPLPLVGTAFSLEAPKEWIDNVFAYWSNNVNSFTPIGHRGIDVVRDVFARSFTLSPLIATRLAEQESVRLALTNEQVGLLNFLNRRRRAAISGGAGTGKTVLALEKARRLAAEGFKTLLTCYNRQLADHLSSLCIGLANLDVMSFHQLCYRKIKRADEITERDMVNEAKITYPGKNLYDVQLPNALLYSLDVLDDRYDAIVCDEGQDFHEEFWVPLELLLTDPMTSPLYVFYDDNQNIYQRASTFPVTDEPFPLTKNCRNTTPIHLGAYKYYNGIPVVPPINEGDEIQFHAILGTNAQASKINSQIIDLIVRQGVAPSDITILIADALHKNDYYKSLQKLSLPKSAKWLVEGAKTNNTVLIDTIQRFKGLESPIVILWGLDTIDLAQSQELLYVGMSRAKSLLAIVGTTATCEFFKNTLL